MRLLPLAALLLVATPALAVSPTLDRLAESCRTAFAGLIGVNRTSTRYESRDRGNGFTMIFVTANDWRRRDRCRVDGPGQVLDVEVTR